MNIEEVERVIGFKIPKDGLMMALSKGEIKFDVIKLDVLLEKRFPEYANGNFSMLEFIEWKFGNAIAHFFKTAQ